MSTFFFETPNKMYNKMLSISEDHGFRSLSRKFPHSELSPKIPKKNTKNIYIYIVDFFLYFFLIRKC